jgi:predicted nucleotidyltransferase
LGLSVQEKKLQMTEAQAQSLLAMLARYLPQLQVWAFGSRVKGTARASSDLDLVLFAEDADKPQLALLREALEESQLPFAVDTLVWKDISPEFQTHIASKFIELQKATPVKAKP